MIGILPESLSIGGQEYSVRSDYRDVLQIFEVFSSPDLSVEEKWVVAIKLLIDPFVYADDVFEAVENGFDVEDAVEKILWFIRAGKPQINKEELPIYDWSKDEQMIFSAINEKSKCVDVREESYLHWWTFLGYFEEIDQNSILSFVMNIRNKINKGKKLEKHEQEFYNKNKELVDIQKPMSKEEREAEEAHKAKIKRVLRI